MAPSSVVIFRTLIRLLLVSSCVVPGWTAPGGDFTATSTDAAPPEPDGERQVRPTSHDAHIPRNPCPNECVCISGYVQCGDLDSQMLPYDIPKDVVDLRLSGNGFDIMPIFPFLPELNSLDMRHNRLRSLSKDDFTPMPSLHEADFSHNEIRLGSETFPANFSISRLNLNKNRIKSLQGGYMDGCINLTKLSLSRNQVAKIEKGFFSTMAKLESLDMSNNKISEIEGITFKGLGKLQHLNLRRNLLAEMLDGAFYELQNLKKLQLDYNKIPTLRKAWLYGLPSLQHLNLSSNDISTIETDAFEFCHDLVDLDLSNNLLTTLGPNAFQHLTRLKRLDLSGNHMIDISEEAFSHLPNLEVLILRENLLTHVIEDPMGSFAPLNGLLMLDLSSNYITAFNEKSFEGLVHLTHLDLNDNPIKTIQEKALDSMRHLKHFDMNSHDLLCYCNLDWLPEFLIRKDFRLDLRCKHPKELRGDLIRQLRPLSLPCDGFPKPAIVEEPMYLQTKTGDNITLTCRASTPVQEPMKFQWKRDKVIISAHKGQVDTSLEAVEDNWQQKSSLHLININSTDAATYQCIVSNDYGTTFSKKAKVVVFISPIFLKRPQNLTLKAGSTAKLECQAEGEPKPEISWHKDGGGHFPAASERRMHVLPADFSFFIVDVKFGDSGTYSCSAENLAGKVTTDVVLTVVEPPVFIKPMEHKDITEGETTVLECMAGGHPKPKLTWTKDSQPLEATSRHFFTAENQLLIIVNSAKTDSGNYNCEIANSVGTERGSSRLTIIPRSVTMASSQSIYVYVVVSVVCCIVVTSFCWVGVIYHTRKRPSPTPTPTSGGTTALHPIAVAATIAPFRDVDSESSRDSGHGDSARRSNEDLQLARGYSSTSDVSEQAAEELEEEEPPEYVSREQLPAMSTFRPYKALCSPHNSLPRSSDYATREEVRPCIPRMV